MAPSTGIYLQICSHSIVSKSSICSKKLTLYVILRNFITMTHMNHVDKYSLGSLITVTDRLNWHCSLAISQSYSVITKLVRVGYRWRLNASPFTLQTEASFLRMSETTSLCRSNFCFNFSMFTSILSPTLFKTLRNKLVSWRGGSWHLTAGVRSGSASCDHLTTC